MRAPERVVLVRAVRRVQDVRANVGFRPGGGAASCMWWLCSWPNSTARRSAPPSATPAAHVLHRRLHEARARALGVGAVEHLDADVRERPAGERAQQPRRPAEGRRLVVERNGGLDGDGEEGASGGE